MKKFAMALMAVVLLLTFVGCGTFSYNIRSYVDVGDYKNGDVVSVSQAAIDKAVKSTIDSLKSAYKGTKDVTEGTIAKDMTVYLYYEGTLVLFDGSTTLEVGKSGISGFDEALKNAEFKDGKAEFDVTLGDDFKMPAFVSAANDEDDGTSKEEPASETPAGEESETSETSQTEETKDYFAGKKMHFVLQVEGKEGKVADGETLTMNMRWTEPGFEGGTYNKQTEDDAKKEEESETSASAEEPASEEEEEEARPGYQLKIGSGSFIEGFEDGLIGVSVANGTQKTLNLHFPNPYPNNSNLAGVAVDFDVTVLSVTEDYERDLTDPAQFADLVADYEKIYGEDSFGFDTFDAYKADCEKTEKQTAAVNALLNASKTKRWPLSDYEEYLSTTRNQIYYEYYIRALYGQFTSFSNEAGLAAALGMTSAQYEQYLADTAGLRLKRDLVLWQVAKDEGLTKVSADDYKAYCEKHALDNGYTVQSEGDEKTPDVNAYVEAMGGKKAVEKAIVLEQAQERLAEIVTVKA